MSAGYSQAMVPVNTTASHPSQAKHPQVYQIDFTAVASGKRIASTKRRVRWRFGFANPEALAAGETGTACRGEEHDITLVWSITSGKRLILADGQEVHYSASRGGIFDFSWTMRGNHVLKIVAHSSPPLSAQPGFRQYDFFIDGQTFFNFPKVFRLGLAPNDPRGNGPHGAPQRSAGSAGGGGGGYNNYSVGAPPLPPRGGGTRDTSQRSTGIESLEAPHNPDEEEAYLQEAIKNSLTEKATPPPGGGGGAPPPAISSAGQSLLLDFYNDNTSVQGSQQGGAPAMLAITGPAPPTQQYGAPPGAYGAPPAQYANAPAQYAAAPAPPQYATAAPTYPPAPGYGAPAPLAIAGPAPAYGAAPADPWGAPTSSNPAYAAAPAADPWGAAQAPPAPAAAYGFATPGPAPTAAVEFGSPPPQPTPSSLGFASPQTNGFMSPGFPPQNSTPAAPNFAAPAQDYAASAYAPATQAPEFAAPTYASDAQAPDFGAPPQQPPAPQASDPALFTMSGLSGQVELRASSDPNVSLADQAYAKYASMAEFDLVSKNEPVKTNPFEAAPIGGTLSLADMKNQQYKGEPKKSVMRSAAPVAHTGALVLSGAQQGNNWGQQAGGGYGMQQQQQQPPTHGQQPPAYGQQPPAYGQQQQPPPAYGQQPPAYGQAPPAYGQASPPQQQQQQQQAPPLQQPAFGQQAYGQGPPPIQQQNPYGGYQQY